MSGGRGVLSPTMPCYGCRGGYVVQRVWRLQHRVPGPPERPPLPGEGDPWADLERRIRAHGDDWPDPLLAWQEHPVASALGAALARALGFP